MLTINNGTEYDMFTIEPGGLNGRDEELGSIGVGSSVGHGHDTGSGVLEGEVLILKFAAVDGFSTGAVVVGEVTTLAHEVRDNPVEATAFVAESLFASAQGTEVLCSLGDDVRSELDDDTANGLSVGGHVKVYSWK